MDRRKENQLQQFLADSHPNHSVIVAMKKHWGLGAASVLHKLWTKQLMCLSEGQFLKLGGRFSDYLIVPRCCLFNKYKPDPSSTDLMV